MGLPFSFSVYSKCTASARVCSGRGAFPPLSAYCRLTSGVRFLAIHRASGLRINTGNGKINRSEKRFCKKGRTAESESGPPKSRSKMPVFLFIYYRTIVRSYDRTIVLFQQTSIHFPLEFLEVHRAPDWQYSRTGFSWSEASFLSPLSQ